MPEQVQKILNNIREFFTTLDTTKKLILGGVALTVLVAIGILSTISLQKTE
ncbi:hypothetical protein LEP1GSC043_2566 [Leptospira weilii str. Ecochallenge]|uniref:Uncharacterized protein n=1 Tax=Leptospira weilii str. Ecochallenge TaxID=1049986 RepID=N1U695_9LEPT|nr:hypothetical protein LEP1GSC043_2566 [Leptospira weilii str. Ecochallenge]